MRTVEREQYIAERAKAAEDATWEVVAEMGDRVFSYQDVTSEVSARLHDLGFDWFGAFGDLPEYDDTGLWGWLAVATGIAWLVIAVGLWGLQSWARTATMIIAGFALFEATLAFFQFPGSGVGFAMAIMPGLILLYLMSADIKVAFAENDPPAAM
jgi:cytochrome c oxidase subunit IV